MHAVFPFLLTILLLVGLPAGPSATAQRAPGSTPVTARATVDDVETQARTVLAFGPRVTGTPTNEQARTYLEGQFMALGYETRREVFRYRRFLDLGSSVTLNTPGGAPQMQSALAVQGSEGGRVTAEAVAVPGTGRESDFAQVDVRGRIAVVQRGEIATMTKVSNALVAGAAALVLVSPDDNVLSGRLGSRLNFPVLAVGRALGQAMTNGQPVTVDVNVKDVEAEAVNLVAFKSGVTAPEVLFGAHLDSVHLAPGANDNLSGTLAVLDVARRAVNTPVSARSLFVLFDAEEDGLLGAHEFVKTNADLVRGLKGMLNFDMVGVNAAPLRISGQAPLADVAGQVTDAQIVVGTSGGSDHAPFQQAGVNALFFHRGLDAHYHQPGDTLLDPALIRETARAGWRVALRLLDLPLD